MKFIRRAVEDDKNLQVVDPAADRREQVPARCDVGSPDELVGGFPKTREELFAYRAIILGSVEAASFTPEQLRMLADFVSKRGGGLLMLGGRRSFAEGGWGGTPVGEVLPVELDAARRRTHRSFLRARGAADARRRAPIPVTQIADTEQASSDEVERHAGAVSTVNPIREVEAGRDGAAHRRRQRRGRIRSCSPTSATAAARRSRCRCRTRGSGRWTRRSRSPTRRTRCSGGGWSGGSSTACPSRSNVTTTADRVEPGEPIKLSAEVARPGVRRGQRRAASWRRSRRRPARPPKCRSSGR